MAVLMLSCYGRDYVVDHGAYFGRGTLITECDYINVCLVSQLSIEPVVVGDCIFQALSCRFVLVVIVFNILSRFFCSLAAFVFPLFFVPLFCRCLEV